ncbi:hypothetical protein K2173_028585 [Erythroxylum novogranatense]|uniref:MraW methylase family protein n=1 Tax=Erythroxylum novogranatense TaxID=1862640 RepID=A0AAV8U546_9ROSI|nr:hypothetical protein K2173_028585 [Erythroxylum novogranatense]
MAMAVANQIMSPFSPLRRRHVILNPSFCARCIATARSHQKGKPKTALVKRDKEKRRTRSVKTYDLVDTFNHFDFLSNQTHVPVMIREVVDVFSSLSLLSFVDCTLGAAGHSSAIIKSHPELEYYIGMDVDPVAHSKARAQINGCLDFPAHSKLKTHTFLNNFRYIKSALREVDASLESSGVDAILMDLGISSMQVNDPERGFSVLADGPLDMRMDPRASLKAEDILNSWPDSQIGKILREYGEESNWHLLQRQIVQARLRGGLHTTGELADLIRSSSGGTRGGRQGWIKTATRVFQALRIAVNDELGVLEKSLRTCFQCLAPGGRLAVISFHSLEDRIVKKTFLDIVESDDRDENEGEEDGRERRKLRNETEANEAWIRQTIRGSNGAILTKRPITPSEEEERLNCRCRSAKLRVIEKAGVRLT